MQIFDRIKSILPGGSKESPAIDELPTIHYEDLPEASDGFYKDVWNFGYQDGDKFPGGFGETHVLMPDYWTLRARSVQLFMTNLYARGIIRRLVTNEINTGLSLEAQPIEDLLGYDLGELQDWSENVENRFLVYGDNPAICDYRQRMTLNEMERVVRSESLVTGDLLVIQRIDPETQLPQIQLVSGSRVNTPTARPQSQSGVEIRHGVELDSRGRQVAYHYTDKDGKSHRIRAYGSRSGRRQAWLVYGSDKLLDDVRGQPILSIILQSLKEIDRYRDAAQRKAVVNSILAMFIKKSSDKPGTQPLSAGANRRSTATVQEPSTGNKRRYDFTEAMPGMVIQELQEGEEPKAFDNTGIDINFPAFEAAMLNGIAWSIEVPPEILQLSFQNNYSASQAALNEFKIYLNPVRQWFGAQFLDPIYQEFLVGQVLTGRIQAPGLLESYNRRAAFETWGAWVQAEWCGQIKPSTDMRKTAQAYNDMVAMGSITRARATREMTGQKYSRVVRQLKRENEQLVEANRPLEQLTAQPFSANVDDNDEDN